MEIFGEIAAEYQEAHGHNPHERAAISELSRRLPPKATVLDLGCGTGVPTGRALTEQGHRVFGIDTSSKMLDLARRQVPQATFSKQDMRDAEFADAELDAVTAYFSLMMLPRSEISLMLRRIRRWLKSTGLLSLGLVEFDGDSVDVEFMGLRYSATGYTREGLEELLVNHGFSVIQIRAVQFQPAQGHAEAQVFCLAQRGDGES